MVSLVSSSHDKGRDMGIITDKGVAGVNLRRGPNREDTQEI